MTRFTPQWLQAGSYSASMDRRLVGALWPNGASSGAAVTPASAMILNVAAGQVAVPTQNNTGATLCTWDAVEQVTLAAAPGSGSNRYDVVIVQPRGNDLDGGANTDFILTSVTGTAVASPTVPAIPAGSVALAQVYIPGGSASITAGNITDVRPWGLAVAGASALPPPVAGNLQSFTDATGEVWVAKGGVYGGAWKKARDVLHSRWGRAAAYTYNTGGATVPFDSMQLDPYGLYATSPGQWTIPVAGIYTVGVQLPAAITAAGQYVQGNINVNGATVTQLTQYFGSGSYQMISMNDRLKLNAGDLVLINGRTSVAVALSVGVTVAFGHIGYQGTG